jgi:hypothetical protein
MPFSETASAKSAVQIPGALFSSESFLGLLNKAARLEIQLRMPEIDKTALEFYSQDTTKLRQVYHRAINMDALPVALSNDAEDIKLDAGGEGFENTITNFTFRKGIAITRELVEEENYGVIAQKITGLVRSAEDTIQSMAAYGFNQAFETTACPFLMEDGLPLISASRPNARAEAGTWSNVETTGALTLDSIFQAALNFRTYRDDLGRLAPMELKMIQIRPEEEKTAWELLEGSEKRPGDAMNAGNWANKRFTYKVMPRLTTAAVFYWGADPGSAENELKWYWMVRPEVEEFKRANNPDVVVSRIRYRAGFGGWRPYAVRGQELA